MDPPKRERKRVASYAENEFYRMAMQVGRLWVKLMRTLVSCLRLLSLHVGWVRCGRRGSGRQVRLGSTLPQR